LDPKTWLLGADWEDFIHSCEQTILVDWTMMHKATSLGVKWQPWSEIGPYQGVQAVVNGQQFAITYPRGAVVAGKHAAKIAGNGENTNYLCPLRSADS
jgi:hypothetical protein